MKIKVERKHLLERLKILNLVVDNNPIVPILENIKFEANKGSVTLTASNIQNTIQASLQCEVIEEGQSCIQAQKLLQTVGALGVEHITVTTNSTTATITTGTRSKYKTPVEDVHDFPEPPISHDGSVFTLPTPLLNEAITSTKYAISRDEMKPSMNGLYLETDGNDIKVTATDGNQLSHYNTESKTELPKFDFIMPSKAVQIVSNLLRYDEYVNINATESTAQISVGGYTFITKLIDENYPAYQVILATKEQGVHSVSINRERLIKKVKVLNLYANKSTSQLALHFNNNENNVTLTAEDIDFSSEAEEVLNTINHVGGSIKIGLNGRLFLESIMNMTDENVTFVMQSEAKPIILTQESDSGDTLRILTPMLLHEYSM